MQHLTQEKISGIPGQDGSGPGRADATAQEAERLLFSLAPAQIYPPQVAHMLAKLQHDTAQPSTVDDTCTGGTSATATTSSIASTQSGLRLADSAMSLDGIQSAYTSIKMHLRAYLSRCCCRIPIRQLEHKECAC